MARKRRYSEREDELRTFYKTRFIPLINEPTNVDLFAYTKDVLENRQRRRVISEDPDFPVADIARAVKQIVRGEEDGDPDLYEQGAQLIIAMDSKYMVWRPLGLRKKRVYDAKTARFWGIHANDGKRVMQELFPTTALGPIDEEIRAKFGFTIEKDTEDLQFERNSSTLLFVEFLRYLLDHKPPITLGVCHYEKCNRLYLKAKQAPSRHRFCRGSCREKARYQKTKR